MINPLKVQFSSGSGTRIVFKIMYYGLYYEENKTTAMEF